MKIGIINYNAGNIKSVANALKKIGIECDVLSNPGSLNIYDKLILPGVGAAKSAMTQLQENGFVEPLKSFKKPILGICLGLQLFSDFSEEGGVDCLSVIPGVVRRFDFVDRELKVPQIGWNKVFLKKNDSLFDGIQSGEFFYFVNSYYLQTSEDFVIAKTSYGIDFASVVRKENFFATQFHPEKSGEVGLKLLNNFCLKC
ncbi:MAG TPA: imidazole glycerol phosphate synthase subunit HisH [Candidatus Gracilibacteria bacterium]|nr:imidazole glycerol phosphate synthase subunit HisH [Candidatus Gracilibacteria bacterium]